MYPMIHPALAADAGLQDVIRSHDPTVAVRLAWPEDAPEIADIAGLETSPAAADVLPAQAREGRVLVAERDGEVVAALSLVDGLLVSDPRRHEPGIRALLRRRAGQLARGRRWRRHLMPRRPRLPRPFRHA